MTTVRVAQILSAVFEASGERSDVAHRLVMACTRALPVTGVGLVLMSEAGPAGMVAISDKRAGTMEELQFTLGEGPCVECSDSGRPVLHPDLARTGTGRWPGFCAGALDAGIRAIFAFPLRVGGIRLGVLDLYRDQAGELTAAELTEALSFADAATTLLLHLQSQPAMDGSALEPIAVIEDRAEVHQATGVISVQAGISMGEALVRLRARSFSAERPILELARDVVAGAVSFDPAYDEKDEGDEFDEFDEVDGR